MCEFCDEIHETHLYGHIIPFSSAKNDGRPKSHNLMVFLRSHTIWFRENRHHEQWCLEVNFCPKCGRNLREV